MVQEGLFVYIVAVIVVRGKRICQRRVYMEMSVAILWSFCFNVLSIYEILVLFAGMNCFAVLQREFWLEKTFYIA